MGILPTLLLFLSEVGFLFGIAVTISYGDILLSHSAIQGGARALQGIDRTLFPPKVSGWMMMIGGGIIATLSAILFFYTLPADVLSRVWILVSTVSLLLGYSLLYPAIASRSWAMWRRVLLGLFGGVFFVASAGMWYLLAVIPIVP